MVIGAYTIWALASRAQGTRPAANDVAHGAARA